MPKQPLVTIGTPFYNSAWSFNEYARGIVNLTYPKKKTELIFADHKSKDNTLNLLKDFKKQYESEYRSISVHKIEHLLQDHTHIRNRTLNIAQIRNFIIEKKAPNTNLIFLDSDCILPSNAIQRFLKMTYRGDICSATTIHAISNYYAEFGNLTKQQLLNLCRNPTYLTETLKQVASLNFSLKMNVRGEIETFHSNNNIIYLPKQIRNKIIPVIFCGFCCVLIKNTVLKSLKIDMTPSRHDNLSEDSIFCLDARKLGFKIVVDTGLWADHIRFSYEKSLSNDFQITLNGLNPKCPEYDKVPEWLFKRD